MNFVKTPNLPLNMTDIMVVSPQYQSVIDDLRNLGINLILTQRCDDLQFAVSFHPDMLCHHCGGNKIIVYPYSADLNDSFLSIGMKVSYLTERLKEKYPFDVLLNAARIDNKLICNKKYTDKDVLSAVTYENIISVNQGYTKCSTLIVDENSLITSDESIAKESIKAGISVLKIESGGIRLDGYDYGFIGGAGVKLSKDKLYFTGKLKNHKNRDMILNFINERNIEVIEGSAEILIDVGSMLPITEKD